MGFPETVGKIKVLYTNLKNDLPVHLWVESVAYQRSIVDQLQADGYPAKNWMTGGTDKRARLALVSTHIQSGAVVFPRKGAEKLITQLLGFGSETHDDLCDAFGILVLSVIEQDSRMNKGYHELFDEKLINESYCENLSLCGESILGVIMADDIHRTYSTIVVRGNNGAKLLYHEMEADLDVVMRKVIEFARKHEVPFSDQHIFVDNRWKGAELCKLMNTYGGSILQKDKYQMRQRYGFDIARKYMYNDGKYDDYYAASFGKLKKWLQGGAKLVGYARFDDLLYVTWKEHDNQMQIIDKETLVEDGIDISIPEALVMTFVARKRDNDHSVENEEMEASPYSAIGL
jgi:predicted phage terminase large subunit-like protein